MAAPRLLLRRRCPTGCHLLESARPLSRSVVPDGPELRLVSESKNHLPFAHLTILLGSDFDSIFRRPRSSSVGVSLPVVVVPFRVAVVVLQASIPYDLLHHGAPHLVFTSQSQPISLECAMYLRVD
jgi:hypothetical protein